MKNVNEPAKTLIPSDRHPGPFTRMTMAFFEEVLESGRVSRETFELMREQAKGDSPNSNLAKMALGKYREIIIGDRGTETSRLLLDASNEKGTMARRKMLQVIAKTIEDDCTPLSRKSLGIINSFLASRNKFESGIAREILSLHGRNVRLSVNSFWISYGLELGEIRPIGRMVAEGEPFRLSDIHALSDSATGTRLAPVMRNIFRLLEPKQVFGRPPKVIAPPRQRLFRI